MPFISLKFPPGISRPGTVYDARGRWYDCNFVRWVEGVMQPIGGWTPVLLTSTSAATAATEGHGMYVWRGNNKVPTIVVGTATKAYMFQEGVRSDITPSGFTAGIDSAITTAYTSGTVSGTSSVTDEFLSAITEAQAWTFDNFGEDLLGVATSEKIIQFYEYNVGAFLPLSGVGTGVPTTAEAILITPEQFALALAVNGDQRTIAWSDQADIQTWGPTTTNQAGDLTLSCTGRLLAAKRGRGETVLWTDSELFALRYVGGDFVYSAQQVGTNCGAISRRCMDTIGGVAFWMGKNSFFMYDGFVRPVPCEVSDYVFSNLNRLQSGKVWCETRAEFGEITWHYPSSAAYPDRYVTYNVNSGVWAIGTVARSCGVDRGAFPYPVAADENGALFYHEYGNDYVTRGLHAYPFATSGPIEIGNGDQVMHVRQIVPDEKTLGNLDLLLYSSMYPTATETTNGPFTTAEPTLCRITARQVRLKIAEHISTGAGWRLGTPRLEVVPGGLR